MRAAVRYGALGLVALTVVASIVSVLVAGTPGLWGALIGAAVGGGFILFTALGVLLTAKLPAMTAGAVLLGTWLLKLILAIVVMATLDPLDFYNRNALVLTIVLALVIVLGAETYGVSQPSAALRRPEAVRRQRKRRRVVDTYRNYSRVRVPHLHTVVDALGSVVSASSESTGTRGPSAERRGCDFTGGRVHDRRVDESRRHRQTPGPLRRFASTDEYASRTCRLVRSSMSDRTAVNDACGPTTGENAERHHLGSRRIPRAVTCRFFPDRQSYSRAPPSSSID